MPKQTRYKGAGSGSRPSSGPGLPVVPLLALVLLIGVAVFMARRFASEQAEQEVQDVQAEQAPAYVPFASVPDERPPARRHGAGGENLELAPEGLAQHATWLRALEVAEQGRRALELSQDARAAEDVTAAALHAREARDAYEEAVRLTAGWMEEQVELYTEDDRHVRQLARERDRWLQRLTALRRTTGR